MEIEEMGRYAHYALSIIDFYSGISPVSFYKELEKKCSA